MKPAPQLFLLAVLVLLIFAGPVAASSGDPLFGSYWQGFLDFWKATLKKQNGVVMGVLGVGADRAVDYHSRQVAKVAFGVSYLVLRIATRSRNEA